MNAINTTIYKISINAVIRIFIIFLDIIGNFLIKVIISSYILLFLYLLNSDN